ncbi:MAG: 2-oxopent-4-enoate hydratase [Castellaniella sp.]|uniref:2-oxopent-4-enoate hydratase n=1 Tax=Castellaniella hirudinis TaxID=1144617 RepID=A0ABV8RZT0_9BURK
MEPALIERLGDELHAAWTDRQAIDPLTSRHPDISIEDAYHVQQRMVGRRLDAGARVVGKKIGVTSQAVMDMLGVYQPDFGYLLSDMVVAPGEAVSMSGLIQPKAEGEIAFILKKDLRGPGVTVSDVLAATEAVTVCFEIVDSRIRDWKIKIQDTVADNASCGVFVLGDRLVSPRGLDLRTCGMVFEKNGELLGTGAGAAALGHPANAVAWLANALGALGVGLNAGEIILSGALAAMTPVVAGDSLQVSIGGIGACGVRFIA